MATSLPDDARVATMGSSIEPAFELADRTLRRQFVYRGLQVEEIILLPLLGHSHTLIWCLGPLEEVVIDPHDNPMFYVHHEDGAQDHARANVRQAFDRHHFPG